MKIIGVYGLSGSGKSIFAEAFAIANNRNKKLIDLYDIHYRSLSTDMKKHVSKITGVKMEESLRFLSEYGSWGSSMDFSSKQKGMFIPQYKSTIGQILQSYGLAMKHVFGDRFWIDQTIKKVKEIDRTYKVRYAILDGIRYKVDVDAIKEAGGIIVKITRNSGGHLGESRDPHHISEVELLQHGFDIVIHNEHVDYSSDPRQVAVNNMVEQLIKMDKLWN